MLQELTIAQSVCEVEESGLLLTRCICRRGHLAGELSRFILLLCLLWIVTVVGRRTIKDRLLQPAQLGSAVVIIEFKQRDLVVAFLQPRCRQVNGILRAYVPEASQRVTVNPDETFAQRSHVEIRVSSLPQCERAGGEVRPFSVRGLRSRGCVHRQSKLKPACDRHLVKPCSTEALALVSHELRLIETAGVFDENIQAHRFVGLDADAVLVIVAVEFTQRFAVHIDDRVVIEVIETQESVNRFR